VNSLLEICGFLGLNDVLSLSICGSRALFEMDMDVVWGGLVRRYQGNEMCCRYVVKVDDALQLSLEERDFSMRQHAVAIANVCHALGLDECCYNIVYHTGIAWANIKRGFGRMGLAAHLRQGVGKKYDEFDTGLRNYSRLDSRVANCLYGLYIWHNGQELPKSYQNDSALFGTYMVYDHFAVLFFKGYDAIDSNRFHMLTMELLNSEKNLVVDLENGMVCDTKRLGIPAVPYKDEKLCLFRWFQRYAERLLTGAFRRNSYFPKQLDLFPQDDISSCVTRGVLVQGCSIYMPEHTCRWAYQIRIRLLAKGEDGYLSPEERGFSWCRLVGRTWRIRSRVGGREEVVSGDGVIGLFPVFVLEAGEKESGYIDVPGFNTDADLRAVDTAVAVDGAIGDRSRFPIRKGDFVYASCTTPHLAAFDNYDEGAIEGHFRFATVGDFFNVTVPRIKLRAPGSWL